MNTQDTIWMMSLLMLAVAFLAGFLVGAEVYRPVEDEDLDRSFES